MPRHVAIEPGRLYPQPGYSIQIDKEGKWTATQVFLCHRSSAVALMPRPGTPHPEIPFIAIARVAASVTEGDLAEIVCHYAGAEEREAGQEKANAAYTMGLSLSEEPILTHKRYATLDEDERDAIRQLIEGRDKNDDNEKLRSKVESELGLELLAKVDKGITGYYSPRVTWRESWVRDKPATASELNDIGKVSTPSGPAPSLAGGARLVVQRLHPGAGGQVVPPGTRMAGQ